MNTDLTYNQAHDYVSTIYSKNTLGSYVTQNLLQRGSSRATVTLESLYDLVTHQRDIAQTKVNKFDKVLTGIEQATI